MVKSESEIPLDVKLYVKEARALLHEAMEALPLLRAAEERRRKAKERDEYAWLWWIIIPVAIVVWLINDFKGGLTVVAIGFFAIMLAELYQNHWHEKQVAPLQKRYAKICNEWCKKFGSMSDLTKLELMLQQQEITGTWYVDGTSREFDKWWVPLNERLYAFGLGEDVARKIIRDEYPFYYK